MDDKQTTAPRWWRIDAPHFYAALRFGMDDRVDHSAHILRWSKGKTLTWMLDYCRRKGWQMEALSE